MRENLMKKLFTMLFFSIAILATSCSKDDMDAITLKRNGSINVTVLKGDGPVVNQKVRIISLTTNNEIDVLITNEKGQVDFGKLNDGPYEIIVEVTAPNRIELVQEIQVISGETTRKTIQLDEYLVDYSVKYKGPVEDLFEDDMKIGICIFPAYKLSELNEDNVMLWQLDVIDAATAIKYFDTEGSVKVTVPVGEYIALLIVMHDDGYPEFSDGYYHRFTVRRLDDDIHKEFVINI